MFVEAGEPRDWSVYGFTIVGSGPAGLFLAERLAQFGRVLVLEAGGNDPLGLGQGYYDVVSTGRYQPSLGSRLSAFGGTSNHWGGHSRPLSPTVFERRGSVPGWPIAYQDYAATLAEAARWLKLPPLDEAAAVDPLDSGLLADHEDLGATVFGYSNPIVRLGDNASRAAYAARPDIDILLETRALDIRLADTTAKVDGLDLLHRPSGKRWTIPVRTLILAGGGIENARTLLWAARKYSAGNPLAGGPNQLTGKYFNDHLYFSPVDIFLDGRIDLSAYPQMANGLPLRDAAWLPSDAFFARHALPRFAVFPDKAKLVGPDDPDIAELPAGYLDRTDTYLRITPHFLAEQTPHAGSFVALDEKLDTDGVARPRLNWSLLASDTDGYKRGTKLFCGLLSQYGFAKARLKVEFQTEDWASLDFRWNNHHMGTTRMGDRPEDGVVDRDCKVFGLDNLFVAGSSVFPTSDFVNPTLNLLALAARLGNHLAATRATRLGFGVGQAGNFALTEGWSYPEAGGVWSVGKTSMMVFDNHGATSAVLAGSAYHGATGSLSIDGKHWFSGKLDDLFGMTIPLPQGSPTRFTFSFDNPVSPLALGESTDPRELSLSVRSLELK